MASFCSNDFALENGSRVSTVKPLNHIVYSTVTQPEPDSSSLCFLLFESQHVAIRLPDSLAIFELLVLVTDEFPQLCVGVRDCGNGKQPNSQQLKFDIIELNNMPFKAPGRLDCSVFLNPGEFLFHGPSSLSLCRWWGAEGSPGHPAGQGHRYYCIRK